MAKLSLRDLDVRGELRELALGSIRALSKGGRFFALLLGKLIGLPRSARNAGTCSCT